MKALIAELKKMDTTSVSDAMDKLGVPCGLLGIQAVIPGHKICGEAFTVHYVPCGMAKGAVGDYLDDVRPGQVLVIDNADRNYCAVWGDIMTYAAKAKGIEGTLIGGMCRDVNGIEELGYGIYARGRCMVTGRDRVKVDAVNTPVSISNVLVCPGDIILGDDSGALCIPKELAEKVLEIAREIQSAEQQIIANITGSSSVSV